MSLPVMTAFPDRFAAGTTVKYTRSLADFPATAGWTLAVSLSGAANVAATVTAVGDAFTVVFAAGATASLAAGVYTWAERVTLAGEVYDAAGGTVFVTPNVATAPAGSLQSWEEKELVLVEAAIADLIAKKVTSYQIGTRAATYQDLEVLYRIRAALKATVRAQQTGSATRQVPFAFTGTRFGA